MEDTVQQQVPTKTYQTGKNNFYHLPQQVRFTAAVRYVFERGILSRVLLRFFFFTNAIEYQQVRLCSDFFVSVSVALRIGVVREVEIASLPHVVQSCWVLRN